MNLAGYFFWFRWAGLCDCDPPFGGASHRNHRVLPLNKTEFCGFQWKKCKECAFFILCALVDIVLLVHVSEYEKPCRKHHQPKSRGGMDIDQYKFNEI